MEPKKSPKADLENKRNIFVQIGFVVALGLCLLAFEWTSKVDQAASLGSVAEQEVEDEIIPITRQEEVKPPPPPPPPKVVEVLNIVDDETEIEDELEIEDTDIDEETAIEVAPVIQEEEEADEGQVFFIVEDMPEFPGGELALRKFIANSIKYPVIAQENGIQGKVYVNFVVDTDGSITNARIARGVDNSLDKEALRVVNTLPKWKPGQQRGKPVKVSYTVPINFVLQ
ncbi:energy transducer TonB [Sunxiuqinia dokdonensis]|uniref:Cell envelope biogenesis protein TonB n=1 Tax=Sunxiuqinia dokdonensis TaxID=1409788 RepID=A0A0L8VA20_9BACT|nr:energy transducer TonB [Sunxiuqinia dokdonensis]KOH45052.1 cell envelope biogenesis protein TonB [Sunxiuqinia dokdonensis]